MKTIALIDAVQQITKHSSIQLSDVDGRSFLNHTHVSTEELNSGGLFAKCYLQAFASDVIVNQLNEFTWVSITSICKSERLDDSSKVNLVRKVLDSTGLTIRIVVESWNDIGVLKSILNEWVIIQKENGLMHVHLSHVEILLGKQHELSMYQEMCDLIFSDAIPDPSLV